MQCRIFNYYEMGQIVLENMVEGAKIFKSLIKKIHSKKTKVIRYNIYHVNLCKI